MKYIFSLLFLCSFFVSSGQMTVNEMMKIQKMNLDQFETYAIGRGYSFKEIKKDDYTYGHTYTKGYRIETKYLSLYTKYFSYNGNSVTYQTSNSNEFLSFKNQMKNLHFELFSSNDFQNNIVKEYRNNYYGILITTLSEGFEITIYYL